MKVEAITEVVDYLDENYNPGVDVEHARYMVTYELSNGKIENVTTEVILHDKK